MQFDLLDYTADFVVRDDTTAEDPDDDYDVLEGGTLFTTVNHWGTNHTDGFVIGPLDGDFQIAVTTSTYPKPGISCDIFFYPEFIRSDIAKLQQAQADII